MIARKIFQRKKSKTKFIIITLVLLFIIMTVYYFFADKRDEFVIILETKNLFYIYQRIEEGRRLKILTKKV